MSTYPSSIPDLPRIDVLMPRRDQPPLGVSESASVPSTAAIANAIYDATGALCDAFTQKRILRIARRAAGVGVALTRRRQRQPDI
jgi:CO/xanthine dehydrogenase Mo-binding subunit